MSFLVIAKKIGVVVLLVLLEFLAQRVLKLLDSLNYLGNEDLTSIWVCVFSLDLVMTALITIVDCYFTDFVDYFTNPITK